MANLYGRPVWAEIDLGAIARNMREIRRATKPDAKIMAIVKANGYGHGAVEVARTALANGADRFGISILSEGIQLRKAGFGVPILILGYTPPDEVHDIIRYNLTQTIYTYELAEALSWVAVKQKKVAKVHIKVDTGMGRIGFIPSEAALKTIVKIAKLPNLEIEGIFTHFACADEKDKSYSQKQLEEFLGFVNKLETIGIHIPIKHAANSAAVIDLPETHLNLVRPGIIIYGLYPSENVNRNKIKLTPAMTLKAQVSFVKKVSANTGISYGRSFITAGESQIASLPFGYADGYSRLLSSKGEVLIKGQRCPVIGRVCMDQCMVDVTSIKDVEIGDEVTIFGKNGNDEISVEEIAKKMNTINYEIVCMITERVPRVFK